MERNKFSFFHFPRTKNAPLARSMGRRLVSIRLFLSNNPDINIKTNAWCTTENVFGQMFFSLCFMFINGYFIVHRFGFDNVHLHWPNIFALSLSLSVLIVGIGNIYIFIIIITRIQWKAIQNGPSMIIMMIGIN